ncbi:MAG: hypothetical protein SFX73_21630 [Kofleriaceae bacterium]|nr:hypothetical protein [Kofleriaceae bacterium]
MKRLAGLLVLVSATASASPTPMANPPTDWREDPEASSALSIRTAKANPLGSIETATAARAYFPTEKGIGLYVARASAETGADHRAAATAAIDAIYAAPERAKALGGTVTVEHVEQHVKDMLRTITVNYTDTAQKLTFHTRLVLAATKTGVVASTGECIWGSDVAPALIEACKQALATIDTGTARADRVMIDTGTKNPFDDAAGSAAPAPPAAPQATPPVSRPQMEPARLDDSDRLRMTPMSISPGPRETDRRPVYVGAGIVVLAVIFWWNRRRRDQLDRERAKEEGRDPGTQRPQADDDADDLRAAARGAKDEDA